MAAGDELDADRQAVRPGMGGQAHGRDMQDGPDRLEARVAGRVEAGGRFAVHARGQQDLQSFEHGGEPRAANFAERNGEPEIQKLVAILIQNDRFGTSMGESLRQHSDFLRTRRRQEAEERAGKVGVKLVFPIFFFILPSMLIVAAGPGILQIFKYLFPMMKHLGQ